MIQYLDRMQPAALLAMRVVLGAIMVVHGYPKVFGGLGAHTAYVASLGVPGWLGYFSAFGEFLGGLFLIFGILTRAAALAVLGIMAVAIWKVHWKNGFVGPGNYQFPLALASMALVFVLHGGGVASLDRFFFRRGGPPRGKNKGAAG